MYLLFISLMCVEVGESGKGSEIVSFCFLSEKLVQRKSAHANTGNGKCDLVSSWAHEMACVVLCEVIVTGKLAENFVSSFIFGITIL